MGSGCTCTMLLSLACRGLLKVALQRQGQTLEEEDMETRYLIKDLCHLGPPSGWQCFLGKPWACMTIYNHSDLGARIHPGAVPPCTR